MTAPVTLTFTDGSQVALSRVGDVVTAVATPGALTSFGPPAQAIPSGFAPGGNVSLYTLSAPAFGAGAWSLLVDEIGYFGSVGITPQSGGAGPWSPFTAQWLADPSPVLPTVTDGDELADFYVHTVTVETYQGTNGYGEDLFAAPVAVAGFLDDSRKLVRSLTGEQVISESQFYTRPINGALFSADSRVTVDGVVSRVIRTNVNTSGDLDLPDHAVVSLT